MFVNLAADFVVEDCVGNVAGHYMDVMDAEVTYEIFCEVDTCVGSGQPIWGGCDGGARYTHDSRMYVEDSNCVG